MRAVKEPSFLVTDLMTFFGLSGMNSDINRSYLEEIFPSSSSGSLLFLMKLFPENNYPRFIFDFQKTDFPLTPLILDESKIYGIPR